MFRRSASVVFLLTVLLAPGAARAGVDVQVSEEDGTVYVDARANGLFEDDLDAALRSGLPARVAVEVVLVERRVLFDREVVRADWEVSVVFDLLDARYRVFDAGHARLMDTADLAEVEDFVGGFELWPLCPVADLDEGRDHAVEVRFAVEPLSVEEVRDLERWLRGNVTDQSRLRDVPGQLVGMLRNRLGLGGHSERGHSDRFRPGDLGPAPAPGLAGDAERD